MTFTSTFIFYKNKCMQYQAVRKFGLPQKTSNSSSLAAKLLYMYIHFYSNQQVQGQIEERLGKPYWYSCHTNGVLHEMFTLFSSGNFTSKL